MIDNLQIEDTIDHVEAFGGGSIEFSHIKALDGKLRPYQAAIKETAYSRLDSCNSVMIQMPTGTGKTIVFTSMVKDICNWCMENSGESHVLIVAHRRELIQQASNKLGSIEHGIIMSGCPLHLERMVQVASIQTFMSKSNYEKVRQIPFDFIIIDEAHHSLANSYRMLWKMYPNSKKIGVSATPCRINHEGFTELFSELVVSYPIKWFIQEGYLSNYTYISIKTKSSTQKMVDGIKRLGVDGDYLNEELSKLFDRDSIRSNLYKSYCKYCKGKKGIVYAIDRKHAVNIVGLYATNGVNCVMIDGTTPVEERQAIISEFRQSKDMVIVNVNIFSEGFDCPDIEFIQLARPTKSLSMYLQQVGRGLRPIESKEFAIILDNVGLYNRFGTPMADRDWKQHFTGYAIDKDLVSDSSSKMSLGGVCTDEKDRDYSEGDEEMIVVEHCEGGRQLLDSGSENVEAQIGDFNVYKKNGMFGICARNNRTIVPPIYDDMHPYYKGYIPFKINGKWGILLGDGTVRVKAKYYYIGPFVNGLAEVRELENSKPYYINDKLEKIV